MLLTECWIPGVPKTKGSMENVGRGNMKQSVVGSTEWARLVTYTVQMDLCARLPVGWTAPADEAVNVRCRFFVPKPLGLTDEECAELAAIHKRAGDDDKLLRNVMDALEQAGVYADDVQVDDARVTRHYALGTVRPGAYVKAWLPLLTARERRIEAENEALPAMLRAVHGVG